MDNDVLTVLESGKQYNLKPLGEVRALHFMALFVHRCLKGCGKCCCCRRISAAA